MRHSFLFRKWICYWMMAANTLMLWNGENTILYLRELKLVEEELEDVHWWVWLWQQLLLRRSIFTRFISDVLIRSLLFVPIICNQSIYKMLIYRVRCMSYWHLCITTAFRMLCHFMTKELLLQRRMMSGCPYVRILWSTSRKLLNIGIQLVIFCILLVHWTSL